MAGNDRPSAGGRTVSTNMILFGVLVILLSVTTAGDINKPRFVWTAFPLFIGAAANLPRAIYWPVLVLSAAGLAFLIGWWPYHSSGPAP